LNAKADPVGLCNQVLGRLAVEKVLDDGTILAVDNLTSAEVKKIWEINRGLHVLDAWEPSKFRNLTMTDVEKRIAAVRAQIDAISDLNPAKTALNSMYADMQKMARVIIWLLKREMQEI